MSFTPLAARTCLGVAALARAATPATPRLLQVRAVHSLRVRPDVGVFGPCTCRSPKVATSCLQAANVSGIRHKSKKFTTKKTNTTIPASEEGPAGANEARKGSSGSKQFNVGGVNSKKRSASGRTEEDWKEVLDTEEAFDADQVRGNMNRSVKRARDTVAQMVGSFGRVDPGK